MECDIHLCVEVKKNGEWRRSLPPKPLDESLAKQAKSGDAYYVRCAAVTWYDDRNYNTFAMLANVRNGYGFAGCDTGDGFQPISKPRGLPKDLSAEVLAISKDAGDEHDIWLGDHSHSWL